MSQSLKQVGEKALLQRLSKHISKAPPIVRAFSEDCAVIDSGGDDYQILTVDSLVEGVHFHCSYIPAYFIGRKAIKVNLSDIAAMGGVPLFYMISLGAPPDMPERQVGEIYEGLDSVGKDAGIQLLGGNISSSPCLFIDLFLIGSVARNDVVMRNGAHNGDSIFITGPLGASAEGLLLLRDGFRLLGEGKTGLIFPNGQRDSRYVRESILTHLDPPLLTSVGRSIALKKLASSMIDISDGLVADLNEICRESQAGAVIELSRIPIAPSVLHWERKRKRDPLHLALRGGEDYHLLFTVPQKKGKALQEYARKEKLDFFEIGKIVDSSEGVMAITEKGEKVPLSNGFEHFQQ